MALVHRQQQQEIGCSYNNNSNAVISSSSNDGSQLGKYVRYSNEQVEALERLYNECPKPSSFRRQQLIRDCPLLHNIDPKHIKVWFQNRRCREKQRKESARIQTLNSKLTAMNKLLMEENDRLQKQIAHFLYENRCLRHQGSIASSDTNCESVITSQQQNLVAVTTPPLPIAVASPYTGILSLLAEETLVEFLGKATGTALDWVPMRGMKPGPDNTAMINISTCFNGVAARACGLVGLEPAKVVEALKDRPSWHRDCRRQTSLHTTIVGNNGTIDVLYMQTYAPTTLAPARDVCILRYTSMMQDGSYVICERSLDGTHGVPVAPLMQSFVRANMHASGYLIRPCEGTGSIVILVEHMNLEPWAVPEMLRPLYESSVYLAHKSTVMGLRHLRHVAEQLTLTPSSAQQATAIWSLSQRLARGFNDAVNGFSDDGWCTVTSNDDVIVMAKPNQTHDLTLQNSGILCAKASMLLQNVPVALLVRFLREHRSEWAHCDAASRLQNDINLSVFHGDSCASQVLQSPDRATTQDEFLELIKMEGDQVPVGQEESPLSCDRDKFLLQLCSGLLEDSEAGAQLVFAPIDASLSDEIPLIPSGFRVLPLDSGVPDRASPSRTLDLASTLEIGAPTNTLLSGKRTENSNLHLRSVLTIALQLPYKSERQREVVASLGAQYVRSVVTAVQRVALALQDPPFLPTPKPPSSSSSTGGAVESQSGYALVTWICRSYKQNLGMDMVVAKKSGGLEPNTEEYFNALWHCTDAILCFSCKDNMVPVFAFANRAGLEMLEASCPEDLFWDKVFQGSAARKDFCSSYKEALHQGYSCIDRGIQLYSRMGKMVACERAMAWKVAHDDDDAVLGVAFIFFHSS